MSTMAAPQVELTGTSALDVGLVFKQGWRLFVKDVGSLLIAALIAGVLSVVTLGILAGPMYAGLYGMVVARVRDGRRPEVGDVFAGLGRFWAYVGAALALAVLIGLASITIIGGILLATIWVYVFPLMVERDMGLGDAMRASKDLVVEKGFWEHLALVLLLLVVNSVIGWPLAVVTVPLSIAVIGVAYFVADGRVQSVEQA